MSGSGGGSGSGSGSGGARFTDCLDIMAQTVLNSPVPEVIGDLKKGDILSISISMEGERRRVLATKSGLIAGSITFGQLATLINCIEDGYEFVAIIISISGGSCIVEIRPKSEI